MCARLKFHCRGGAALAAGKRYDFKNAARSLWARLTRAERTAAAMLGVFAVKFLFSTAARFVPALQGVDMLGSGRSPVDVWLLLLCCAAVLGTFCLYRRAMRAVGARLSRFQWGVLAACCALSAAFYISRMAGRQTLYLWDNATYYNLQVRLESNFADGVFVGVGSTIYKTWFNDYAPLVINLLTEPFFMFTDRTANTYAMLGAALIPAMVYLSAAVLLDVLARRFVPRAPRLFFALGMAFTLCLPLLHAALYRGMPDLLGVAFGLMLLALGCGYDFSAPAPARLTCMTVLTGMLMVTRRCYMFWVAAYFLLYGLWVLARAAARKNAGAAVRLVKFAAVSLVCVGLPLAPMFWHIVRQNYADRYATYQTGGFAGELTNQVNFLGLLAGGIALAGVGYGLLRPAKRQDGGKTTRPAAALAAVGAVLTVLLVTRVQNMDDHQSLAVAPFYLLGMYLCALGAANLRPDALRRGAAGALAALCAYNFAVCGFSAPRLGYGRLYSGTTLWVDADRTDFGMVHAVNAWLKENCHGDNSAYMICHGSTYSPDVFRELELPDETIRRLLPYGACNPGNDAFPLGVFTAQVVLTCDPFDPNNHTEKIDAAFREAQALYAPFALAECFDMGNGYTIYAYRRVKEVTREEVEVYRAALAEEDARFPYNFGQVFDAFETRLGL